MTKELERAGITTSHICTMTPIAIMVGSNRIVRASGILHPLGNPDLEISAEKQLRRAILETALEAIQTELSQQQVFYPAI